MLKKNQVGIKFHLDALFIQGALVLSLFSGAGSIVQILQYFDKVGVSKTLIYRQYSKLAFPYW
jgi:hypothetical protein